MLLATVQIKIGEIMFNIESINPNVLYAGFLFMIVLSGVGEYVRIVPPGTASGLLFSVFGGSLAHVSFAVGNNQASKNQAQTAAITTQVQAETNATNGKGGTNGTTSTS